MQHLGVVVAENGETRGPGVFHTIQLTLQAIDKSHTHRELQENIRFGVQYKGLICGLKLTVALQNSLGEKKYY